MIFTAPPSPPTLTLHDIADSLWKTDREAYWSLRHYIAERDQHIQTISELIVNHINRDAAIARAEQP